MIPTLTDYRTGAPIRPATREEWQRSKAAATTEPGGSGTFILDGRVVFVSGDFPATAPTAHTPEPWATRRNDDGSALAYEITVNHGRGLVAYVVGYNVYDGTDDPETQANAARIVAAVNACEGIDDPGAALAEVREILTRAAWMMTYEGQPADDGDAVIASNLRRALALLGAK